MEKQIYSYDEAYEESLRYFQGDELAARVWVNKYAVKDSFGNIYEKSPEDMHWRIANEVARIESKYPNGLTAKELYDLLDHFKYIVPQGSPMTGIGNDYQVASLSNCFRNRSGRRRRLLWCYHQNRRRTSTIDEKTWWRRSRSVSHPA